MNIAKEVKGNEDADFVPAGQIAEIDPGRGRRLSLHDR